MKQENWDNLRIAWQLAQSGTLTKAGQVLRMNHTTVLRHINQLEAELDCKLFIRHQRGYQLTDAGVLLTKAMPDIEQSVHHLINRLRDSEQSDLGKLRITTLTGHSNLLNKAVETFRQEHPKMQIYVTATEESIPIESGAVHISIRVGNQPTEPDVITKKLMPVKVDYYASSRYIAQHGFPEHIQDYNEHLWALPSGGKQNLYFVKEMMRHLKSDQVIYQSNYFSDINAVVQQGLAIGPMTEFDAKNNPDLTPLNIQFAQEHESVWFVYHRDLKNNSRIKSFYQHLTASLESV